MKDKTDLESCKTVAESFLELDIVTDPVFGEMLLHHPFFCSPVFIDEKDNMCNFIEDHEALNKAKAQVKSSIDKVEEFQDFSMILQKPYLLAFLKYTHFYLSREDLSRFLSDAWTLNKDVAKWFSLRFSDEGVVYKAEIKKEDVFAVFLNRGEQEIVLNYKKLENVRTLKQDRRRQNDLMR